MGPRHRHGSRSPAEASSSRGSSRSGRHTGSSMAKGTDWVPAEMPRCVRRRCYQIGAVTLAEHGVVFTRTTTGPDDSVLIRRGFSDPRPSEVRIPGDPQPELAPSSAGALNNGVGHGWLRWDFGPGSSTTDREPSGFTVALPAHDRGAGSSSPRRAAAPASSRSAAAVGARTWRSPRRCSRPWPAAGRARGTTASSSAGSRLPVARQSRPGACLSQRSQEEHTERRLVGVVLAGKAVTPTG